jgi:signal recognition particle receptor subunit beta/predicted  nucleic acid-binding Zn-ribbon protein
MVIYNAATRELTAKIVYYGPGLGGKTTNLQVLHDRLEPSTVGKLLNLSTHTDRTIYFDLLPVELGDIKGYKIRFQLATVPGQTAFNETRKVVLKGADGVVFVADSQWTMLPKNLEAWQNLKDNLKANGVAFEGMPIVIQYNKRDLNDILSVEAMQEALGLSSFPFVEAVASAGRGVTETFKLISKLTFVDLLRRLQGRRPEEASLPTGKESKDDLQSWRQSLFTRVDAREPRRPRPLAAVPTPSEEAPFETGETPAAEAGPAPEGPFASKEAAASPEPTAELPEPLEVVDEVDAEAPELLSEPEPAIEIAALAERATPEAPLAPERGAVPPPAAGGFSAEALAELETRLEMRLEAALLEAEDKLQQTRTDISRLDAACNILASRLEVAEGQAGDSITAMAEARQALETRFDAMQDRAQSVSQEIARIHDLSERVEATGSRLDGHEQRLLSGLERLAGNEKEIGAQDKRQRTLEDDVGMALAALTERAEKLQQQISGLGAAFEALQRTVDEKTNQGHREAEDIRTQLAPLLEAHGQRHAADERMLSEIDRLRESLADSLADLSENLRRAVRGL